LRLHLAISLRYLRSPRSEGAISFITWIALFGVMLGVAALLVAMAVMNGYQANLVRVMASALPHVTLNPLRSEGLQAPEVLVEEVKRRIDPVAITPFVMQETLVRGSTRGKSPVQGVMVRGILPEVEGQTGDLLNFVDDGSSEWETLSSRERRTRATQLLRQLEREPAPGVAPVLLSRLLAGKLGVGLGDPLTPMKFPEPGGGFSPQPAERRLVVKGFFETGLTVFDELVLITHLKFVPEVLSGKPVQPSLGVRLRDPLAAAATAKRLRDLAKTSDHFFFVYSWLESNKGIFQVIRLQKVMLFIVLMLIVVIAFFGMVSALTMLVVEKTKEIAVLKSLGISPRVVMEIFVLQGLLIGVVGTVLGLALGLVVCGVLDSFPLLDIPPGVYPGSDKIPVLVAWLDVLWIVGGTMAVCLVATIFPARKAGLLLPAEGLRYG
jgi:lipoprotein-releasing system permease protein